MRTASREGVDTLLSTLPPEFLHFSFVRHVTHLVMNEWEAAILSRRSIDKVCKWTDLDQISEHFLHFGVENVVIALAAKSAYLATSSGEKDSAEAQKNVKVIDTTGTGYVAVLKAICRATAGEHDAM